MKKKSLDYGPMKEGGYVIFGKPLPRKRRGSIIERLLTCMAQPIARPFSEEQGNDEVISFSSGAPIVTGTTPGSSAKVFSRSLNRNVPVICWTCGDALDTEYYWAQVNGMSPIRRSIKFGGPTIRALQCCPVCIAAIYKRYSASRESDYSLPVFCLVPVPVSSPETEARREETVAVRSVRFVDRSPGEDDTEVAESGSVPPVQRSALDIQRASKVSKEGMRLLDRPEDATPRIRSNLSRPR
jgi:hypothetical protein